MTSTDKYLRNLLSSLNGDAFTHFIYEMWKVNNVDSETKVIQLFKKAKLGKGVLEQKEIHWDTPNKAKSHQTASLIIPFSQPVDLLLSEKSFKLFLERENTIIKKYDKEIRKRVKEWYWPNDGEFNIPSIMFVSNIEGLEKETYFDNILPKLGELLEPYEYFSDVGIGTYDSFIDRVPEKTKTVLKSLFISYPRETSLVFKNGAIGLEQHLVENYLRSGVLTHSFMPCDTVISALPIFNIEVFKEFENIINRKFKEDELEKFLSKYFQQIFGSHYERIETQLWLRFPELDINRKERKLDIFLRNAVERDWELIELKATGKIVTNYRDVPTLSARITGAISQLRNYERILQQDSVKKKMQQQGIEYYEPQLRLVVGGKPEIPTEQWRRIKMENEKGLKITTCEDLIEEMKYRYSDFVSLINIENK
ncbi:MAG: hypothetical protein ABIN97_00695 [Ginsengibacter sp.]